jgi:hypothetical protein
MRNISFSLTKAQFLDGSKDVTRRNGWWFLNPGDVLMGCEKCMGRKSGEPLVRLGKIEIVSARREVLGLLLAPSHAEYAESEMRREGFPNMRPTDFVLFFLKSHQGLEVISYINRIEFKHLP